MHLFPWLRVIVNHRGVLENQTQKSPNDLAEKKKEDNVGGMTRYMYILVSGFSTINGNQKRTLFSVSLFEAVHFAFANRPL